MYRIILSIWLGDACVHVFLLMVERLVEAIQSLPPVGSDARPDAQPAPLLVDLFVDVQLAPPRQQESPLIDGLRSAMVTPKKRKAPVFLGELYRSPAHACLAREGKKKTLRKAKHTTGV